MRLFVSYARVDRPFCEKIVHTLETAHQVWHDRRLHAGKKWWDQILSQLKRCEGFIYLLSPESVASDYCWKEYIIARDLGKRIFPVKIRSNTIIPAELLETQMVDFSNGLTPESVVLLMAGINIAEREQVRFTVPTHIVEVNAPVIAISEGSSTFAAALDAYHAGRLDEALFKLKQVRESGYDPGRFVNLDEMLKDVQTALEEQAREREAERRYQSILQIMDEPNLREQVRDAFAEFQQEFPDYDPQNIAGRIKISQAELAHRAYLRKVEQQYEIIARLVNSPETFEEGCERFAAFQLDFPDYDPQDITKQCEQLRQQRELEAERQWRALVASYQYQAITRLRTAETWKDRQLALDEMIANDLLNWADLNNVVLEGLSLQEANLEGTNLRRATLWRAKLQKVYMENADLEGANLVEANLAWAALVKTNLSRANLQGAFLESIALIEVDLQHANLEGANLTDSVIEEETRLPDGSLWNPDTDMARFTDPNHPKFWRSGWVFSPAYRGED